MIVIAHRLSTIRDLDRIAFMSAGRIADVGTLDELYAERADFREMVNRMAAEPDEALGAGSPSERTGEGAATGVTWIAQRK